MSLLVLSVFRNRSSLNVRSPSLSVICLLFVYMSSTSPTTGATPHIPYHRRPTPPSTPEPNPPTSSEDSSTVDSSPDTSPLRRLQTERRRLWSPLRATDGDTVSKVPTVDKTRVVIHSPGRTEFQETRGRVVGPRTGGLRDGPVADTTDLGLS